jgi:hypothetical protein
MLVWLLFFASQSLAETSWHVGLPHRSGKRIIVPCHGEASDRYLATRIAMNQCRSLVTDFLQTTFHIQSLTVQTNYNSSYHSEVSSDQGVSGLECVGKRKDEVEHNGTVSIWIECDYDTSKVKVKDGAEQQKTSIVTSDVRSMTISTVPICKDIVIGGKRARTIDCAGSNPVSLVVYPEDTSIILRATGYKPVHLTDLNSTTEVRFEK